MSLKAVNQASECSCFIGYFQVRQRLPIAIHNEFISIRLFGMDAMDRMVVEWSRFQFLVELLHHKGVTQQDSVVVYDTCMILLVRLSVPMSIILRISSKVCTVAYETIYVLTRQCSTLVTYPSLLWRCWHQ